MGPNKSAPRLPVAGPLKGQDAGAIVRAARFAAGLTLAELGRRCGYSASQVTPPDGSRAGRHAVEPKDGDPRVGWPTWPARWSAGSPGASGASSCCSPRPCRCRRLVA